MQNLSCILQKHFHKKGHKIGLETGRVYKEDVNSQLWKKSELVVLTLELLEFELD